MAPSQSKIHASLRSLLAKRPGWQTVLKTIDRYEASPTSYHDDRAMVLLCVSLLEQALEEALLTQFLCAYDAPPGRDRLFGGDGGAVSTFAGKITLGHALGLYGSYLRDDLDRLRRIRNVFAHARTTLKLDSPVITGALVFHLFNEDLVAFGGIERHNTPKGKFLGAIGLCLIHFFLTVKRTRRGRPRAYRTSVIFHASPAPSPRRPTRPPRSRPTRGDPTNPQPPRPPRSSPG